MTGRGTLYDGTHNEPWNHDLVDTWFCFLMEWRYQKFQSYSNLDGSFWKFWFPNRCRLKAEKIDCLMCLQVSDTHNKSTRKSESWELSVCTMPWVNPPLNAHFACWYWSRLQLKPQWNDSHWSLTRPLPAIL